MKHYETMQEAGIKGEGKFISLVNRLLKESNGGYIAFNNEHPYVYIGETDDTLKKGIPLINIFRAFYRYYGMADKDEVKNHNFFPEAIKRSPSFVLNSDRKDTLFFREPEEQTEELIVIVTGESVREEEVIARQTFISSFKEFNKRYSKDMSDTHIETYFCDDNNNRPPVRVQAGKFKFLKKDELFRRFKVKFSEIEADFFFENYLQEVIKK